MAHRRDLRHAPGPPLGSGRDAPPSPSADRRRRDRRRAGRRRSVADWDCVLARRRAGRRSRPVAALLAAAAWRTWTARSRWPGGRPTARCTWRATPSASAPSTTPRCPTAWPSPPRSGAAGDRPASPGRSTPGGRRLPRLRLRARRRRRCSPGVHECCPARSSTSRGGQVTPRALLVAAGRTRRSRRPTRRRCGARCGARLEDAVSRRLPPGEPVGAFLSGGLDSSLVVALARRLARRAGAHVLGVVRPRATRTSWRGARWWPSTAAPTTASSSCRPRSCSAHLDERSRCWTSRSATRSRCRTRCSSARPRRTSAWSSTARAATRASAGRRTCRCCWPSWLGDGADAGRRRCARERSYLRAHQKCYDDLPAMLTRRRARPRSPPRRSRRRWRPWFADPRWRTLRHPATWRSTSTFKGGHHILPKVDALSAPFGVLPRSPLFDRAGRGDWPSPSRRSSSSAAPSRSTCSSRRCGTCLPPAILERPKSGMLVPVEGWFPGPLLHAHARERLLDGLAPLGPVPAA